MGKIHKLDKNLIPKIAAGEVVDRPTSLIKELMENSLDAGATEIIIEINEGGKELIRISDNGEGMDKEDLEKCWLPFTTSKISTEDNLNNIETLGFRGEALSSISAVSNMTIKTKTSGSKNGYELKISGGDKKSIKPVGMDNGTIIEVAELFFNVPARKRFLKSENTEIKQIIRLVEKAAMANWKKTFRLISNGKVLLDLRGENNLKEKVLDVYKYVDKDLLEVENSNEYLRVFGYIGSPKLSSYTGANSSLFVNRRIVENTRINKCIKNAYGKIIESNAHPFFILFLEMLPSLVNVNIHPQKKDVHFWNEKEVEDFLEKTIREVLQRKAITYDTDYFGNPLRKSSRNQFDLLKEDTSIWNVKGIEEKDDYEELFQIGNTYIVTHTKEGLVLVDQHAAHESILYEQYMNNYLDKKDLSTIEVNKVIQVSGGMKNSIENNMGILNIYGFDIEGFGGNSFKVNKIPTLFKDHDLVKLLEELLESLETTRFVDEKTKQTIAFLSCRGAIKAGEKLTKEEMKNILKKLEESNNYLTCPHGRPTKVTVPFRDMEKIFKRL